MAALCKYTQWSTDTGLVPVLSWQNMDIYEFIHKQINKLSDFKLSSDLLNILFSNIYIV